MRLRYPGVEQIKSKGRCCTLMKHDLSRQFPIDPGDINLLGFIWRALLYYNLAVVMGMSTSCYFLSNGYRCTQIHISKKGF